MNWNKKIYNAILIAIISLPCSYFLGYLLNCLISNRFSLKLSARLLIDGRTFLYMALILAVEGLALLFYYYTHYWLLSSKNIIRGKQGDLHLDANSESSRFQTDRDLERNFRIVAFPKLRETEITGSIIKAEEKNGKMDVVFAKPAHTLVIGTTGSGKTTTYVNPTIQILSETKTKPSMFISDPKGELYADHAKRLKEQGYEVKVLDLRNPYNSIRWNPLQRAYEFYQRMIHLKDEVVLDEEHGRYLFDGNEYETQEEVDSAIQVKKQQLYDIVYEDLHDITTAICPIENKNEPMWESGAKNFVLAIALAMLEDSEDPNLGLTKDKFNFYSITKVATNTDNDCEELIAYFQNRSPLSKAVSLSKQVLDASDKTRGSYLSTTFDKLSMFSDLSLCALTSENEIEFGSMGERPIALFLQIPDEKETRHTLASLVVLQAYKELVAKANSYPTLSLPKPVYFILDEFGNLPKVHKLEQMITVGRSRNIWMNLVVQSYSQLSKVYEEKSADIIKSNCNIQIFIGTTDYKTIEEFSKRCGNFSMVQRSVGFNSAKGADINSHSSIKERPLIYPSELQLLNNSKDMGNAIVTVFGYHPIRSKFTPSFQCHFYRMDRTEQRLYRGRYFDEEKAFYDMSLRKKKADGKPKKSSGGISPSTEANEVRRSRTIMMEQLKMLTRRQLSSLTGEKEIRFIVSLLSEGKINEAMKSLTDIQERVSPDDLEGKENMERLIARYRSYMRELTA
mgnify:FL=1